MRFGLPDGARTGRGPGLGENHGCKGHIAHIVAAECPDAIGDLARADSPAASAQEDGALPPGIPERMNARLTRLRAGGVEDMLPTEPNATTVPPCAFVRGAMVAAE